MNAFADYEEESKALCRALSKIDTNELDDVGQSVLVEHRAIIEKVIALCGRAQKAEQMKKNAEELIQRTT